MSPTRSIAAGAVLCFSLLNVACESGPARRDRDEVAAKVAAQEAVKPDEKADAKAGEKAAAKEDKKPEGEKPDKQDALRKKERELDYARRDLRIARLAAENDERDAKDAVEEAERKLKEARLEREHFLGTQAPLRTDESALAIERSTENRERQKQELEELEAMYKEEELATLTKELVIRRSRKDVELAQKSLDLEARKQAALKDHELPKKQRELEDAVVKTEKALATAKTKESRSALEKELKLLKAEHAIDELEREVAKLKVEIEKQKQADAEKAEVKA